ASAPGKQGGFDMVKEIVRSAMGRRAPLSAAVLLLGMNGATAADPSQESESRTVSDAAALDLAADGLPAKTVDLETLADQRARQGVTYTQLGRIDAQIDLRDNQVNGGVSGDNVLGQSAFDGASGISTIIQNTGHNVAIQESLIINIAV